GQERDVTDGEHRLIIIAGLLDDLDPLTDDLLGLLARGDAADAAALTFLLQRYRLTDRADVRAALEPALSVALEQKFEALPVEQRAQHLVLFVDATAVADGARVQ